MVLVLDLLRRGLADAVRDEDLARHLGDVRAVGDDAPPEVSSSTVSSSSRQALFERSKPFVGAVGPVAAAVDT